MSVSNRFRRALASSSKERPVLDLAATTSEAVTDILWKDELFAAVPVFAMAFKTVKALDSTRDRLFAAKLLQFVRGADELSPEARQGLCRKLVRDDEGRKAAETLLLVLERVTDMDKPALLGFLIGQLGNGRIGCTELRRLANAVDLAFADDLAAFLDEPAADMEGANVEEHREALVASGLTRLLTGDTASAWGHHQWLPTPLGKLLHSLVAEQTG